VFQNKITYIPVTTDRQSRRVVATMLLGTGTAAEEFGSKSEPVEINCEKKRRP
jgi:hypothetical protein